MEMPKPKPCPPPNSPVISVAIGCSPRRGAVPVTITGKHRGISCRGRIREFERFRAQRRSFAQRSICPKKKVRAIAASGMDRVTTISTPCWTPSSRPAWEFRQPEPGLVLNYTFYGMTNIARGRKRAARNRPSVIVFCADT